MLYAILDRLCCPLCKGPLCPHPFQHDAASDGASAIRDGLLSCAACKVCFPVVNYVPVMLVFETSFHRSFAERFASQISSLAPLSQGFNPEFAHARAMPGERSVQETFTEEWDQVHGDELSFTYTTDDLVKLNRDVWLRGLLASQAQVRSVLDVGCGLGRESDVLKSVTGCDEVFGVDLNFALLQSGAARTPGAHLVIASLFNLPFRPESFDLVYSQGVLHHTCSTRMAVESIARFAKPGGHVFVWVYGLDDHLVPTGFDGALKRAVHATEGLVRPLVARAPRPLREGFFSIATLALHAANRARVRHSGAWSPRNTNHNLRDRFSPRFAHRHSYNELLEWFEDLGLDVVDIQSPAAYRRLFNRQLWGVGLTGRRRERDRVPA
jgi:SAM-dependent methyltransferase/uncharacterized protein YbaR (Trm112 family)